MSAAADHADHHGPPVVTNDEQYGMASPGKLAMWIFLLSDAFSFGGLLLAYGILRGGATPADMCPPGGEGAESVAQEFIKKYGQEVVSRCWHNPELHEPMLGINFTAGLTFLLICSSVTMVLAHAACTEGNRKKTLLFLGLTVIGGAMFLCGQYQEYFGIWSQGLTKEGLVFGHSGYASTFYITTGFHGMHVATGVLYLTIMWIRTAMGKYDGGKHDHLEIAGLFWHFVDLVWILVFTFIYLI
jgi:heme/copper-type cytochrome/quinol oxidase subunit 3